MPFSQLKLSEYLGNFATNPSNPLTGDWWYNTTTNVWYFFDGTSNIALSDYLGKLAAAPASPIIGQWWYNTTDANFVFYNGEITAILGGTWTPSTALPAEAFGLPNTNPPGIVDQDNLTLYKFTVNTDHVTYKFPVPSDYHEGPLNFSVVWTNDGGVDDNGKNVKWQLDYQVGTEGDVIAGSHANSPKTVVDTYASASGWVEHHTDFMLIAAADFAGKACIFLKLSAITAPATVLSCEPHLVGMCFGYTAKRYLI